MAGYLLDTNVLSELRRPKPAQQVCAFIDSQPLATLHVSSVTLAEFRFGIESVADLTRRAALGDWLALTIRPMFVGRVLEVTENVMLRWRLLVEDGRKRRHTYPQPDLIIAATALDRGLTLVTRDTGDFAGTGVALFDPWTGSTVSP
jgi:toxin FitB